MNAERSSSLQWRVKKYAEKLIEMDRDIEEVVLIGSLVNGNFGEKSDIDLVCLYDEELEEQEDSLIKLYSRVNSLWVKLLPFQKALEINYLIDLGFMIGSDIILVGLISNYSGKHKTLAKR